MIDEGIDQLCELVTVCNPWHGHYHEENGFISRHGVPIAFIPADPVAQQHTVVDGFGSIGCDAHLVNFGMPELTTPQQMLDLGQEMWNKAILFGREKFYSIKSTWGLGALGWPYKAADGSVWFMRVAMGPGNTAFVYADPLTFDCDPPTTLIATLNTPAVPTNVEYGLQTETVTGASFVNFAPNNGAKAAYHVIGSRSEIYFILEIDVAGGDGGVHPTVTGTANISNSNFLTDNSYVIGPMALPLYAYADVTRIYESGPAPLDTRYYLIDGVAGVSAVETSSRVIDSGFGANHMNWVEHTGGIQYAPATVIDVSNDSAFQQYQNANDRDHCMDKTQVAAIAYDATGNRKVMKVRVRWRYGVEISPGSPPPAAVSFAPIVNMAVKMDYLGVPYGFPINQAYSSMWVTDLQGASNYPTPTATLQWTVQINQWAELTCQAIVNDVVVGEKKRRQDDTWESLIDGGAVSAAYIFGGVSIRSDPPTVITSVIHGSAARVDGATLTSQIPHTMTAGKSLFDAELTDPYYSNFNSVHISHPAGNTVFVSWFTGYNWAHNGNQSYPEWNLLRPLLWMHPEGNGSFGYANLYDLRNGTGLLWLAVDPTNITVDPKIKRYF